MTTEKEIKEITDNQGKYFFKEKMTLPYLFVNNYELSETEKLTAIKYWFSMNELTCFNWNYSKKTRKLSKNNKSVTTKTKICSF